MKRTIFGIVAALFVATGANAGSLTIDTDKATYNVGESIVITVVLDTNGAVAAGGSPDPVGTEFADVTANWDQTIARVLGTDGVTTFGASTQDINFTSFGGGIAWIGPPTSNCVSLGGGAGNTCILVNQATLAGNFAPDPAVLTATLTLEALAIGAVGLNISVQDITFAFGTTTIGTNFSTAEVVPEPTTAAMLGLGLLGLGFAGRRR